MKAVRLTIVAIVILICSTTTMRAGENDWHLYFAPSYYINPLARNVLQGGQLGFEKELSHRRIAGFAFTVRESELFEKATFKTAEYSLSGYYKPSLHLGKNSNFYISMGGNIGSGHIGFTFGLNLGLEYAITFRNRMKLYFAQDNLLVFRSDNLLISGFSVGLKIPISK
ncbi:MAG: hypothetical protein PUJ69_02035 [Porphyromonas somerae]|uniref:hypothetical protein n=1 Tax=Porphyromonas TaxID=836 RepID=UPI001B8C0D84|nr:MULTISPECIES: hypothetical protein [Porphyromonas]MDD7557435.1 hypothetical protein [Porphyromonas somerae]MDY5815296.1 hypothetical protein [Porphyromonas somerae]